MNKKISVGVCISLVAIACAITYVLTTTISLNSYNKKIAGVNERESFYTKYQEIDSFVRNNYVGGIDETQLIISMFDGYMNGIGDKYARYLTANDYYELQQQNRGSLVTSGIRAVADGGGYLRVTEVYEGSSAAQLGIMSSDIITAVDGSSVLELGTEKAIKNLQGDEGTRLSITIQRDGIESRHTLIRQSVDIITVKGVAVGNTGYIRISGFNNQTDVQFNIAIEEMLNVGVRGVVIDLRGVTGGIIAPVGNILNRMVGNAVLATAEDKHGNTTSIITTGAEQSLDIPIVVLVDSGTANYAELMASILRDFKNAQIVGVQSAGDATMTKTQVLRDGSAVTISVAKMKSAESLSFDGVGIKPDFVVEMSILPETNIMNIENTSDLQLRKALDVLNTSLS